MTKAYIVEALLRPPVEWYSAWVSAFAAGVLWVSPAVLMAPTSVCWSIGALCGCLSVYRGFQGYRVVRYQKHLCRVPRYALGEDEIPVSPSHLFLGLGFQWEQLHTQRLHDIRTSEGLRYVKPSSWQQWLERKRIEWQTHRVLKPVMALINQNHALNPLRPLPPIGGLPFLHGLGVEDETAVYLALQARKQHLIVKGASGVGKTRIAQILITQDIRRKNNAVIIIDPKGDSELLLTAYQEAERAKRPLYIFHLGFPEYSCSYNAVGSFSRITEVPSRITSNLPGEGDAAAFREFAWMFVNIVSTALLALGKTPSYKLIRRYIRNLDPLFIDYAEYVLEQTVNNWEVLLAKQLNQFSERAMKQSPYRDRDKKAVALMNLLSGLEHDDPVLMGLMYAFKFEKTYYDKITTSVSPFLDKLLAGGVGDIVSPLPGSPRPELQWEKAIRQHAVVYVGLDALTDAEVSSAVGASMFADLTSMAGRKIKYGAYPGLPVFEQDMKEPDVIIHGDEFSDLLGKGGHMKTLLNKSRAAGFSLNLYTQSWFDPEAELGESKAGQIAGNINTTLIMRVQDRKTAMMFCEKLPDTFINSLMAVSGIQDSPSSAKAVEFSATNEDRISKESVALLTPSDITGLSIGQGYALINGSELWKVRFPEPKKRSGARLPPHIQVMTDHMQARYHVQSHEQWFAFDSSVDLHGWE